VASALGGSSPVTANPSDSSGAGDVIYPILSGLYGFFFGVGQQADQIAQGYYNQATGEEQGYYQYLGNKYENIANAAWSMVGQLDRFMRLFEP
jgi:hypothetical protein